MVYITYNISWHMYFQAKHRPLTPNTTETRAFLTHTCLYSSHPMPHIYEPIKSHTRMKWMLKIKNFSFRSQTNAIYLIIYLKIDFKPKINLYLQILSKSQLFSLIHMPLLLTPNIPYISIDQKPHMKDEINAENQKLL